jgi:putative ABC transport system permease protein
MHKFAFKNLWLKKSRSLLALVGLSVAIVGVVGLISISGGIKGSINDALSEMEGVMVTEKDLFIPEMGNVDADLESRLYSIPGVKAVSPQIVGMVGTIDGASTFSQGFASAVGFYGIDPLKEARLSGGGTYKQNLKKGRYLKAGDKNVVVVSEKILDEYNKAVGSTIKLNDRKFRIIGVYSTGSEFFDNTVIIPIDVAREMVGKEEGKVTMFTVEPNNPADAETVAKRISFKIDDVDAKTSSGWGDQIGGIVSQLDMFFLVISSVAIIVGAIGILNTMLMSVLERTKEFGIMKAVGWTGSDIIRLVMFESLFLGLMGGVLGIVLGLGGVYALGTILPFQPVATIELLVSAIILSVFLGVGGGVYPAWKASRLDPVVAIRAE